MQMGRPQSLLGAPYHKLVNHSAGVDNEISRSFGQSLDSNDKGQNQLCETITALL